MAKNQPITVPVLLNNSLGILILFHEPKWALESGAMHMRARGIIVLVKSNKLVKKI